MKIKSLLFCSMALTLLALPSHAVVIGSYPGLDKLIKQSSTIAIVRVDDSVFGFGPDGWVNHKCLVYQTLKGDLKPNTNLPIMLNEFVGSQSNFGGQALAPMTTHLVFLNRSAQPINGAKYSIVCAEGADLPLSPLGNETKPKGKTLKLQIQTLIRRYRVYRDEQIKYEDELLNKSLAE